MASPSSRTPFRSTLFTLPNEVLLLIAELLPLSVVSRLLQTCRFFCTLLDPYLYDHAPHYVNTAGITVLEWAAEHDQATVIKKLQERERKLTGASTTHRQLIRDKALMRAAMHGHNTVIPLLVNMGADLNSKPEEDGYIRLKNCTALHRAAMHGHLETVALLLDLGADINAKDVWGETALYHAVKNNHEEMARLLLARDATPAHLSPWVLHVAVEARNMALLKHLLDLGVDPDSRVADTRHTPLHRAVRCENIPAMELLIERGADINAAERWREETPLHWAVTMGKVAMVRLLLQHGADVDASDAMGHSTLHFTSESYEDEDEDEEGEDEGEDEEEEEEEEEEEGEGEGDDEKQRAREEIVRLILERGPDVFAVNEMGETALSFAKDEAIATMLKEAMEKARPGGGTRDETIDWGSTTSEEG